MGGALCSKALGSMRKGSRRTGGNREVTRWQRIDQPIDEVEDGNDNRRRRNHNE
jgi:hypothetical protein